MHRALITVLLAVAFGVFAQQQPASTPTQDGVYLRTAAGWRLLEPLASEGRAHEHVGRALVFPNMVELAVAFQGQHATVSTSGREPTLMIRGAVPAEVHVVRLDPKKERRLLPIAHGTIFHYVHSVPSDHLPTFDIIEIARDTRVLRARAPLTPGQYIVIFGSADFGRWQDPRAHHLRGYDFEVQ